MKYLAFFLIPTTIFALDTYNPGEVITAQKLNNNFSIIQSDAQSRNFNNLEISPLSEHSQINSEDLNIRFNELKKINNSFNYNTFQEGNPISANALNNVFLNAKNLVEQNLLFRDCQEIKDSNPQASSGVYTIQAQGGILNNESMDVYCDMDTPGEGWTLLSDINDFETGNNCIDNTPTINNGLINLKADPTNTLNGYKGACGISSKKDFYFDQVKVTDLNIQNTTCSSNLYPDPILEIYSDPDTPIDYTLLKDSNNSDSIEGYQYQSEGSSANLIFSKKYSEGLSNNTIYNLTENNYKIHLGIKSESRFISGNVKHSNGNVSNKLMFTFDDNIIPENSSVLYKMVTGWITHNSTMTLKNSSEDTIWSVSKYRNNSGVSTVDDFNADLSQVDQNSKFYLTSSASVWNNSNGNHASDTLIYDVQYSTCMRQPVSLKLWVRNSSN